MATLPEDADASCLCTGVARVRDDPCPLSRPLDCAAAALQILYTSSMDTCVRAWDLNTMACKHVLYGHRKPVTQLQLAGGRLYTAAAGGVVCIWRTDTYACVDRIKTSKYNGGIRSMHVRDGRVHAHALAHARVSLTCGAGGPHTRTQQGSAVRR